MDYAFTNAINYVPLLLQVLLLYDIMCQYWVNFCRRISEVPAFLHLPENVSIKRGIGLFHVHGHVKQCFARYAPTFIRGAGNVDGEIIETLWNPLNHTASSARSMSWFHRQEYLDTHMGDSNWKKLVRISTFYKIISHFFATRSHAHVASTLSKKWQVANVQHKLADDDFLALSQSVGMERAAAWGQQEDEAQEARSDDVAAMDIFDVRDDKGSLYHHIYAIFSCDLTHP